MPNKWFAALLGFFLQPLAFLYLSKKLWALVYLFLIVSAGLLDGYITAKVGYSGVGIVIAIVCAIHAFRTARFVRFDDVRHWYNHWWGILSLFVVFFAVVFVGRSFFYEPFYIPSDAMAPALNKGDNIIVSKWGYGFYGAYGIRIFRLGEEPALKPQRGEIFVLIPPGDDRFFVERIIGLPGDTIEFSDKQLTINGQIVATKQTNNEEQYIELLGDHHYIVQYTNDMSPLRTFSIVVPKNTYFVLGDNRDNSSDSRIWGVVPMENIVGKMVFRW